VVVTQVDPDGPGAEAGLRAATSSSRWNRQPVKDSDAYKKALKDAGDGKSVLFLVPARRQHDLPRREAGRRVTCSSSASRAPATTPPPPS
jgi:hypothetical protein